VKKSEESKVRSICETSELHKDHMLRMADSLSEKLRGNTS